MPVDTRATHYDDIHGLAHEPTDLTLGGSSPNGMAAEDGHGLHPLDRPSTLSSAPAPTETPRELHAKLKSVDTELTATKLQLRLLASMTDSKCKTLPPPCLRGRWDAGATM